MEAAASTPTSITSKHYWRQSTALAVSIILHQLFVTLYIMVASKLGFFAAVGASVNTTTLFMAIAFVFCGIPIMGVIMLRLGGVLTDWQLTHKRDRLVVMGMSTLVLLFGLYKLQSLISLNYVIEVVLTGQAFCCLFCLLVNFFYRVSAHSIGMAGIVGLLLSLAYQSGGEPFILVFAFSLLSLGIVVWARLYLAVHTVAECAWAVVAGGLIGWFAPELVTLTGG